MTLPTNFLATGNSSSCAEFNFYCDPESAFILLKSLSCPIYMLPWETCMEEKINIPLVFTFRYTIMNLQVKFL